MIGVITRVRLNQGYAFVRGVEDGLPRFFNAKDVIPVSAFDRMHEGQQVTFDPCGELDSRPDAKNNGLRAANVRPAMLEVPFTYDRG